MMNKKKWLGGRKKLINKMLSAPVETPAEKNIGATIRIGREIQCLPYKGFFFGNIMHLHSKYKYQYNSYIKKKMQLSDNFGIYDRPTFT